MADVVRAIEAAIDASVNREAIFVGHPVPVTARELLEGVRAAAGRRAVIIRVPALVTRIGAAVGDLAGAVRGQPGDGGMVQKGGMVVEIGHCLNSSPINSFTRPEGLRDRC
ncbi:MAG: hypothetical protein DMF98_09765 [Acidobacteria bacterium]|nr:MAG: hypothetical protein DMF98_09765 [Acidobacteriota bacterium]